ncbi:hypothetical protein [Tindallia californiensis]|uniref:Uncharacterized protein n=1 Tax=Tindallia californiensis TaxID=159292 RepID=A0A1H3RFP2_9FIRM|nr:hypothetical protein [Tindallia californiensis]SDZ24135.1 hypothetical protein SAMN05192546_1201 [Tindallia californiensis]
MKANFENRVLEVVRVDNLWTIREIEGKNEHIYSYKFDTRKEAMHHLTDTLSHLRSLRMILP